MFKKVWQGSVQVLQLAGAEMPLGGHVLASLDLLQIATRGLPFPASRVWDIAAAVAVQERQDGKEDMTSALSTLEVGRCSQSSLACEATLQQHWQPCRTSDARSAKRGCNIARGKCPVGSGSFAADALGDMRCQAMNSDLLTQNALQRHVCPQQDKLEGLERSCDLEEPPSRQSDAATCAHALQLCNVLRRLVLRRLPCPDDERALQVCLSSPQCLLCCGQSCTPHFKDAMGPSHTFLLSTGRAAAKSTKTQA